MSAVGRGRGALRTMRGYAICTEPRSGSAFLCRLLASTGVLGQPAEYFNPAAVRVRFGIEDYPVDPEAQLAAIPRLGATPNGVYGLKIFASHFDVVKETRWAQRLPGLSFIHLQRNDLLGQAISHVRAMQTQQWVSFQNASGEPRYNPGLINNELVRLARAHSRWRFYFARNGIDVLNLVYERIVQTPLETAAAVARLVGLAEAPTIDMEEVGRLRIQRDAINADWRRRFIAEARNLTVFH
jgi:LPS sulfotransferase NodH